MMTCGNLRGLLPKKAFISRIYTCGIHRSAFSRTLVTQATKIEDTSLWSPKNEAKPANNVEIHSDSPLAVLPLSQILRTYFITSISSSPTLLAACSFALRKSLESRTWLTDVENNPILRLALRESFYKQFCAGNDRISIHQAQQSLKSLGFSGAILESTIEVLHEIDHSDEASEIEIWRRGLLATVDMAEEDDFVGIKWSGLGTAALRRLKAQQPPSTAMNEAMREVCNAAAVKNVQLLAAAEEANTINAVHSWSLGLQREYNNKTPGKVVIYNTYQAYLRNMNEKLVSHLLDAKERGYTLGVKLVRGAYLATEPPGTLWESKEETDACYDEVASSLLNRSFSDRLATPHSASTTKLDSFPNINLVLATHNLVSTRKAQAIRKEQVERGEGLVPLTYAQLQGMADEVSCELIAAGGPEDSKDQGLNEAARERLAPKVVKCMAWGSQKDCLNYLLRRAAENRDAAGRTIESRKAMGDEIWRRIWS